MTKKPVLGARQSIHKRNLIYYSIYPYTKLFFFHYYGKVEINGVENIPRGEPVIFAPNHQNALMDALIVLFTAPQDVVFLARADIFNKPLLAFLLNSFKILPVFRQRDGAAELGKNQEIFDISVNVLKNRHHLCVMPEGNHGHQRRLRAFGKGIFRIAFSAQEPMGEKPFVKIVPVGLDFGDYVKQQTSLYVNYGKPIEISDYWEQYRENSARGINALKTRLIEDLKPQMIHIGTGDYYEGVQGLRTIFNDQMREIMGITGRKLSDRFRADKEMIARIEAILEQSAQPAGAASDAASVSAKASASDATAASASAKASASDAASDTASDAASDTASDATAATAATAAAQSATQPAGSLPPGEQAVKALNDKVVSYHDRLRQMRIRDWVVRRRGYGFLQAHWRYLVLILTLPVFLYGLINNAIPYFLPVYLVRKIKDRQFHASVKAGLGILILFPLFYLLQTLLVGIFTGPWWVWVAYLVSLLPAGKAALYWYFLFKKTIRGRWFRWRLVFKDPGAGEMVTLREEIIRETRELVSGK